MRCRYSCEDTAFVLQGCHREPPLAMLGPHAQVAPTSQPSTQPPKANPTALMGCASAVVHRQQKDRSPMPPGKHPPGRPSHLHGAPGSTTGTAWAGDTFVPRKAKPDTSASPRQLRNGLGVSVQVCMCSRGYKSQVAFKRTRCNNRGGADKCSKIHSF